MKASWFGSGKRGVLHGIKRASSVKVKDIQPEGRIWAIVDAIPDALEQLAAKMMYLTGMRPYKELLKLRAKDIHAHIDKQSYDKFQIRVPKGREPVEPRDFFMPPKCLSDVKSYMAQKSLKPDNLLFKGLTKSKIQSSIKNAAIEILGTVFG